MIDSFQIELFLDTYFTYNVHFFVFRELFRFQKGGGGVRRGINFLSGDVETERKEFFEVSSAGFCRVVGDEDELFATRAEIIESFRDTGDDRISSPDDAIAIEDKAVYFID